jgi:ribonuclease HII
MLPTLCQEKKLWRKGYRLVAGLDEAGMGSLAGPVAAAAVAILNPQSPAKNQKEKFKMKHLLSKIRDSKKLTPRQRELCYKILTTQQNIFWGVGVISEKIIDKTAINAAAELAMEKALSGLERKAKKGVDFLLIDGNRLKNPALKKKNHKLIIKADEKVFSCAAASIIAKVTRDRIMVRLHKKHPQYGFRNHKGYPTRFHKKMLQKYGPSIVHRKSFFPNLPARM